ncbi:Elongation factor 4 [Weissella viridescens]|uniref:Elongation factor 4 n=1 Tax=Weissella viridescens TaxID=1629 RepID=A0A380P1Z7_WEIVI|nr:Elongation factor 4 [Weissella viridescens]
MADVDSTQAGLMDLDERFTPENTLRISAKTGIGIDDVLLAIRDRLPAPSGEPEAPLKGLISIQIRSIPRCHGPSPYFDGILTKIWR